MPTSAAWATTSKISHRPADSPPERMQALHGVRDHAEGRNTNRVTQRAALGNHEHCQGGWWCRRWRDRSPPTKVGTAVDKGRGHHGLPADCGHD
jgi:hypothetical protein